MSYVFTGRLRAHTCGGSLEPLANATLMLYRLQEDEPVAFAVRNPEDVRGREWALMVQGRTDGDGHFRLSLSEKSVFGHRGSMHAYTGESVRIEVRCRSVDGTALPHDPEPVQFVLTTLEPAWQQAGDNRTAHWEYDIPAEEWNQVRAALDTWTIHGRVLGSADGRPLAGLKVFAFDADTVQDDFLGVGMTDAEGRFRIDYPGTAFRQTPVAGIDFERGGPELYFRVESADGTVLYREPKSRGSEPDREDASNCFEADLTVEVATGAV
jgi:5-hydroxyisourate hydrolase-like protein (transthyretin family)